MKFFGSKKKVPLSNCFSEEDGSFPVALEDESSLLASENEPKPYAKRDDGSPKQGNRVLTNLKTLRCAKCASSERSNELEVHDRTTYRLSRVDEMIRKVVDEASSEAENTKKDAPYKRSKSEGDSRFLPSWKLEASYEELAPSYEKSARDAGSDQDDVPMDIPVLTNENPVVKKGIARQDVKLEESLAPVLAAGSIVKQRKNEDSASFGNSPHTEPHLSDAGSLDQFLDQSSQSQSALTTREVGEKNITVEGSSAAQPTTEVRLVEEEKKTSGVGDPRRLSPLSFSSLSSFGIPKTGGFPTTKILSSSQPVCHEPTPRPFFWRSHPRITVKSYDKQHC